MIEPTSPAGPAGSGPRPGDPAAATPVVTLDSSMCAALSLLCDDVDERIPSGRPADLALRILEARVDGRAGNDRVAVALLHEMVTGVATLPHQPVGTLPGYLEGAEARLTASDVTLIRAFLANVVDGRLPEKGKQLRSVTLQVQNCLSGRLGESQDVATQMSALQGRGGTPQSVPSSAASARTGSASERSGSERHTPGPVGRHPSPDSRTASNGWTFRVVIPGPQSNGPGR